MKIICAGLWKTGTTSLAEALRYFGYKVYDFEEQYLYYMDEWKDLFFKNKTPDFKQMFENVDALVDSPGNVVFEEILEAFPDARVILTVRDEDAWLRSISHHLQIVVDLWIKRYAPVSLTVDNLFSITEVVENCLFGTTDPHASYIHRKRFRWHNDRVKSVVPPEKLLVFNCKEGWKPLCDFLGEDIPVGVPFPHFNKSGEYSGKSFLTETNFGRKIMREIHQGRLTVVTALSTLVVACCGLYFVLFRM